MHAVKLIWQSLKKITCSYFDINQLILEYKLLHFKIFSEKSSLLYLNFNCFYQKKLLSDCHTPNVRILVKTNGGTNPYSTI